MDGMRSMAQVSTDRDSLMALDALLHIKDSIRGDAARLNGISTFHPAPITTVPNQITMGIGVALPPSTMGNFHKANMAVLQAASAVAAAAAMTDPHAGQYRPKPAPKYGITVLPDSRVQLPSISRPDSQEVAESPLMKTAETEERQNLSSTTTVRKDKVEAALRSKPQRGRKRENLTGAERVELTRTRNREHAKSTRIRKKQRYQELLDSEKRLKELAENEELASHRSQSIKNFLSIRECMVLQSGSQVSLQSGGPKATCSSDKMGVATKHSGSTPQVVAAQDDSNGRPENDRVEHTTLLEEIVEDMSEFQVSIDDNAISSYTQLPVLAKMQKWDQIVARRVMQSLGLNSVRLLTYSVVGGASGIAISPGGSGFARVNLVSNAHGGHLVLSGILHVQFAPSSSRLQSVVWTTIHDALRTPYGPQENPKVRTDSSETLGSQMVYPSVVSLENVKSTIPRIPGGLGMNV